MFTARKSPRQQRSRETVEVILEAATQVFEREGIAATTNRIAERAGVSIGTIYQYFPNKESLLLALAEQHLEAIRSALTGAFDEAEEYQKDWPGTAALLAHAVAEAHAERPRFHRVLHTFTPREVRTVSVYDDILAGVTGRLADQLTRTGQSCDDPHLAAALVVAAVDAQLHRVFLDGDGTGDLAHRLTSAVLAVVPGRRGDPLPA